MKNVFEVTLTNIKTSYEDESKKIYLQIYIVRILKKKVKEQEQRITLIKKM